MPSVKEVWQGLVKDLKEHSFSSPAERGSLAFSLCFEVEPSRVYLFWDEELPQINSPARYFQETLARRSHPVPCRGMGILLSSFSLKKGVFIPRLDTESWVEEAIVYLRSLPEEK